MTAGAGETPHATPFHVLAKPVGPACNLDCSYCFYLDKLRLFERSGEMRMSEDILEEFTRQYIEAQPPGTPEVQFAWQGGEPTLAGVRFFRRAVELQREHARPGMRITNGFQTNGILLNDEWGEFLRRHHFLVGLSIDGPRDLHDCYRRDRRGRGTHQRVLSGLDVLKRHGVEFNTLTVVHRKNADHPALVYDFLESIGSRFLQLIPLVEPLESGGVSDRSVEPEQYGRFLCGVFDRWLERADVGRVFVRDFDTQLGLVMGSPSSLCVYAETCGRGVAIEHSGDVFSCDHFVDWENHLGNVLDGSLGAMLDGEKQAGFGRNKRDALPDFCRSCRYLRLCHGGCPKDRIADTPDGEPGLNHLCAGLRRFFAHSSAVLDQMAHCLRSGRPASDYQRIDAPFPSAGRPRHPGGAAARPGRNDPCPCGSGRKYKKCCMGR